MMEPRPRAIGAVLTVAGALGGLAAFVLMVEKVRVLEDPAYVPSCSINPIVSCGSVMTSEQAEAFGFPNPLLGLVAFSIVGTAGAILLGGVQLQRWFWRSLQVGVVAGTAFVAWLMFQSVYRIGALCPYCLVVWAVMPPLTVVVTAHNIDAGHLGARFRRAGRLLVENQLVVITIWYLAVMSVILVEFWDYWKTLP